MDCCLNYWRVVNRQVKVLFYRPTVCGDILVTGQFLTGKTGDQMKGVVLAGGTGSRLNPLTKVTNKYRPPIYNKPMIYYPIETLVNAGIQEILLVTGGKNAGDFLRLLGNGRDFGLKHLNYTYQEGEGGIAEALGLAEYFAGGEPICTSCLHGWFAFQRDWLHVEDNCRGILAVLERGRIGEVYNIGGLNVVENLTLARRLLRLMDKTETLLSYVKDRPGHDRRYALNCDKMASELGWRPAISLEDGLKKTIDWYKANATWMSGVRGGEYRSYYEKYYENRDSSLRAIAQPGTQSSQ
jgi:hypothetical protein